MRKLFENNGTDILLSDSLADWLRCGIALALSSVLVKNMPCRWRILRPSLLLIR
jgi:hypothetical protein